MRIRPLFCLFVLVILVMTGNPVPAEEGAFPVSELAKLDLRSRGLEIDPRAVFDPDGPSLIYAVVKVGATGSFVSPDGLIITNHHVAFGSVQAASTPENDYVRDGFLARSRADEIPAAGRTARITESFRDVSSEVLSVVKDGMSFADRARAVEKCIKRIETRAESDHPGKRAEVAEMFPGRSYWLFLYTNLKDVRLVYVPPRAIGEFGGETDNWMWPRHTGDFAFMRAYVAPDGSPAEYSKDNVPFRPRAHLRIDPAGAQPGDFVFLLGYPGRTYRHFSSHFIAYQEEVLMPWVAEWYAWQIDLMEKMGRGNHALALKLSSRIKGLSNTMKNYRGKLAGLDRLDLVEKRRMQEKGLQAFIQADPKRRERFGDVLERIDSEYGKLRGRARFELVMRYLTRSVDMLRVAGTLHEAAVERAKPDLERESAYMDRNFLRTRQRLLLGLKNYHEPADRLILAEILKKADALPPEHRIAAVDRLLGGRDFSSAGKPVLSALYDFTGLDRESFLKSAFEMSEAELAEVRDPFLMLAADLYPEYQSLKEVEKAREGALDPLWARLTEARMEYLEKDFIPDANGTLRLTYGKVEGYDPADGVFHRPLTTLRGVLEKTTGKPPFNTPPDLVRLLESREKAAASGSAPSDIPVCLLYSTDTTGGNSGSPVLNARGELVGVNFDRVWEATINDFAWSPLYSRSIGVDIRYVLWITREFSGAEALLKEIGL